MSDWKSFYVEQLGKIITGKTPKTSNVEYYGGDIPFLTPSDDMSVKHVIETKRSLSDLGKSTVKNLCLPKNSVCVSCIGSDLGKVVITGRETVSNQQINSIIVDEKFFDVDFVYYSMVILGKKLKYLSHTSTAVPIINKSTFSKFTISCPPLETQKKIVAVLSALDDKIELNNAINKNLEEQAQAIFKSWFIDFEPFGGTMPDDWRQGRVEEIVVFHDSKRIPLSANERKKMKKIYPYYGATSIIDYVEDYIFNGIFLLFAEDGTVIDDKGFPILQYVEGKFWVNNHAHILTGQLGFSVETLYLLFKTMNINSIITGAVQQKVSQSNLKRVPVVIASYKDLIEFDKIISPMFEMIRGLRTENQKLGELRDALLPKLMSGEIDVSEVEI